MASLPGTVYGHPTCGGAQAKRLARRWAAPQRLRAAAAGGRSAVADRYVRRLARITGRDCGDYGRAVVHRGWASVALYQSPRGRAAAHLARLRRAEAAAHVEEARALRALTVSRAALPRAPAQVADGVSARLRLHVRRLCDRRAGACKARAARRLAGPDGRAF